MLVDTMLQKFSYRGNLVCETMHPSKYLLVYLFFYLAACGQRTDEPRVCVEDSALVCMVVDCMSFLHAFLHTAGA